ncbi:hypothetical protein [Emticicia fontis]
MKQISKEQLIELLVKLDDTKTDVEKYKDFDLKNIEDVAERYIDKKSEFLAGVAGGILGATGGVAIAKTVAGIAIFLSGPAGAILGIAIGMLMFRGRGQHKLERATKKFQLARAIILDTIKMLPADAPIEVKDRLWKTYYDLLEKYSEVIEKSLTDDVSRFDNL